MVLWRRREKKNEKDVTQRDMYDERKNTTHKNSISLAVAPSICICIKRTFSRLDYDYQ